MQKYRIIESIRNTGEYLAFFNIQNIGDIGEVTLELLKT